MNRLTELKNPVIMCHSHADVDAVCSGLILANRLNCALLLPDYMTYRTRRVIDKLIPPNVTSKVTQAPPDFSGKDLIIVDGNEPGMFLGIKECAAIIDHHPNRSINAKIIYSDTTASSTCELLARNYHLQGWECTAAAAGIIDDTNILHSVSPHTLQLLSLLITSEQYNRIVSLLTQHYNSAGEKAAILKSLHDSELHIVKDKTILHVKSEAFDPHIAEGLMDFADIIILETENENCTSIMLRAKDSLIHCGNLLSRFRSADCSAGGHPHAASLQCTSSSNIGTEILHAIKEQL